MSSVLDDEVMKAIEELRVEFGGALPAKVDGLVAAVEAVRAAPADAEAWDHAHTLAHRLHGTAGSYGFARVGSAAGRIEHALEDIRSDEAPRRAAAWPTIDRALIDLTAKATLPPPAHDPPMSTAPAAVRVRPSPKVLVVDDDPDFLRHVEALARAQLFTVLTARTADEALAHATSDKVEAALIDVHLDSASSFDLARRLRSITPTLSLAFISADGSVATRVAAAHAGASVFLSKPLGAYELTSALRRLFAERDSRRARVLVLDDEPSFGALVGAILEGDEIDTARETDPAKVLDALDRTRPDILLADIHMPKIHGVDVCRTIRMSQRWQALPIIVLTQDPSLSTRIAAFDAGADDYLLKPVVPQELQTRVRMRVERARLLHEMTNVDPLSRLLSRRGFLDALAPRMSDAIRRKSPLALALLDVDHFKKVNDRYGHATGDRVLAAMGELLASRFRLEDLRCRWGGEEFVVAFPGEESATIVGVLEKVLEELAGIEFTSDDGQPFRVTFSAGVASYPHDGHATEMLVKIADERLYAAKRAGRARVIGASA